MAGAGPRGLSRQKRVQMPTHTRDVTVVVAVPHHSIHAPHKCKGEHVSSTHPQTHPWSAYKASAAAKRPAAPPLRSAAGKEQAAAMNVQCLSAASCSACRAARLRMLRASWHALAEQLTAQHHSPEHPPGFLNQLEHPPSSMPAGQAFGSTHQPVRKSHQMLERVC